jgi:hypothetical protein
VVKLRIAGGLELPPEVVTETFAILAKRGAGRTYTASVLVEEMLRASLQVVVLDPMGAWWGLRSSADGKQAGFPIAILGGAHADIPLEPTAGKVVADLVVDERISRVLDLSAFSKNDRRRFVAEFLERLYQRNREPMHVVLEEADLFAPEGILKRASDEQMLGAVYDLVRRGCGRGLGATLITQRSVSLSKKVLTQAEILVALRTTGPDDRKAIELWIELHGDDQKRRQVLELEGSRRDRGLGDAARLELPFARVGNGIAAPAARYHLLPLSNRFRVVDRLPTWCRTWLPAVAFGCRVQTPFNGATPEVPVTTAIWISATPRIVTKG